MKYLGKLVIAAIFIGFTSSAFAHNFSGLYIFGDSLSDAGNLALTIGTDPDQTITGNDYVPSKPYASGQLTNGDVWVSTFAHAIGLGAFSEPALAGGGNFAFGGARTGTDGVNLPPSLIAQGGLFLRSNNGVAPNDALYVLQSGGNDARDALAQILSGVPSETVIEATAAQYAHSLGVMVDQLQMAGAHRIVIWNVPNIGLAPALTHLGSQASLLGEQMAVAMNHALSDRMSLEPGVSIFDDFSLVTQAIMNPADYGLTNVTDACGAALACDPLSYLFWDGLHPTAAGHVLLAQHMIHMIPEPAAYLLLLAGLLVVSMQIRHRQHSADC
ncbi:MAG: SGNH/GDSL hydrolase family protein [Nitrosomonas sp.]|nr:SGNH/GDSL hydrolase family protein [Nitrosomonas sp.]